MKKQDVRRLQKKIIENSISGIWKSGSNKMRAEKNNKCPAFSHKINIKASTSIFPNESHECNLNENFNNSNFNDDCDTQVSCTCHTCDLCDCEQFSMKNDDDPGETISTYNSNKNSSRLETNLEVKSNEEISESSKIRNEIHIESNEIKRENVLDNISFYLKRTKIQSILYFFIHIFLFLIVILLKILCYVKRFLFCISNYKSSKRIRTLFVFFITTVAAYKLSNFIDEEYFCNLSNSINRILYSKNDAFVKILQSDGISCDSSIDLYFVETKSHGLIQVEVSQEVCSPIKYCFPVTYNLPKESVEIINTSRDSDLIYKCSKLSYDEVSTPKKDCTKSDLSKKDISDLLNYDYINDYVLIEVIRDKLFCKRKENEEAIVCPYNDKNIVRCLDSHHLCEPKIFSNAKKFNINNQMLFHLSHCYCDRELYNCLRRVSTPLADNIARMYFNHLQIKCFHYEYRYKCKLFILGQCLIYGESLCHAKLINSPYY